MEPRFSADVTRLLQTAAAEAQALTDEYISTEHLLLAMLAMPARPRGTAATDAGLSRDAVLAALAEVRGRQRVTDQNPEEKYQALEQYGRDLTGLARARASSTR